MACGGQRKEKYLHLFSDGDSFFTDSGNSIMADCNDGEVFDEIDEAPDPEDGEPPNRLTRVQCTTLAIFSIANVFVGVVYSVPFSYYPVTALHKHRISNTVMGLILGIYELALVLGSAFFGKFLGHIGPRFVFIMSMLVLGATAILFGFVNDIASKVAYTALCLLIRTIAGIAGSGINTASLALTATVFPQTVTKMLGVLELCSGLGIMLGPAIGGALYSAVEHSFPGAAFPLPLAVCGVLLLIVGLASICMLPTIHGRNDRQLGSLQIALIPSALVIGLVVIMGGAAISYINATLADELDNVYKLNTLYRSLVFVVGPLMYALTAPFWGGIADKHPHAATYVLILGYILAGFSLWLMGPAPFTNIKHMLWLIIFSQVPLGLGIGTVVITFKLITVAAIMRGHPEGFGTTAVVSGLFGSYFSIGAFVGPWLGGYLKDDYGFAWASFHFGCAVMISAVLLLIFTIISNICRERADEEERTRLIN